ncbi:MAG: MBL fold metallo-hydrolase [Candidatus Hodarchaeota archaeon]
MVSIKWLGHACFEIRNRITIVTDPHDGEGIGLKPPQSKADLVLISHEHHDHKDGASLVAKHSAEVLISYVGEKTVQEIPIKGIKSCHDPESGSLRGGNSVYVFEVGGISFCHLGDLGEILSEEQLNEIGHVDVLIIPVGGTYTLDAEEATEVADKISPRIVIPMHYKTAGLSLPIADVEGFLKGKKNVKRVDSNSLTLTKEALPVETEIIVLSL